MNAPEQQLSRLMALPARLPLLGERGVPALSAGQQAPRFATCAWSGEPVELADAPGSRTWVAFFRHASCPMCLLRVNHMIRRYPAWAAPDLRIIGIFHSSPERIAHNVGRLKPPFPLVSDPDLSLYRSYGLRRAEGLSFFKPFNIARWLAGAARGYVNPSPGPGEPFDTVPGDFLVDGAGIVGDAYYGREMGDHIPFARVERWLGFTLPEPEPGELGDSPERSYRELFGAPGE